MIKRSFDLDLLLRATDVPEIKSGEDEFRYWFSLPTSYMFVEDDNVGLATLEYPGVFSTHWYYKCRGRDAINLGKRMCANLFENYGAETLRAFIRVDLKASRWACRQLGFKSHGIITFPDGEDNELFIATKEEFLKKMKEDNNG